MRYINQHQCGSKRKKPRPLVEVMKDFELDVPDINFTEPRPDINFDDDYE